MALVEGLMSVSSTPWVILLIINVILLILGCFMEAIAIMLLTIPIFMPLIARVGVDPVHFGVMLTLNLMIGLLTPPVGMVLYAVSSVSKVPLWTLAKELGPYILALVVCLGAGDLCARSRGLVSEPGHGGGEMTPPGASAGGPRWIAAWRPPCAGSAWPPSSCSSSW